MNYEQLKPIFGKSFLINVSRTRRGQALASSIAIQVDDSVTTSGVQTFFASGDRFS
ncbi:hypothetical protein TNCV_4966971 [Trichonephila clavipes]|nr:hypothetical protein TNCV_4966971 [Trichonephila clavipes]